jgi:hypothetical protein
MATASRKRKAVELESDRPSDVADAQAIFQRYFETQFEPLKQRVATAPLTDVFTGAGGAPLDVESSDESGWEGVSDDNNGTW